MAATFRHDPIVVRSLLYPEDNLWHMYPVRSPWLFNVWDDPAICDEFECDMYDPEIGRKYYPFALSFFSKKYYLDYIPRYEFGDDSVDERSLMQGLEYCYRHKYIQAVYLRFEDMFYFSLAPEGREKIMHLQSKYGVNDFTDLVKPVE